MKSLKLKLYIAALSIFAGLTFSNAAVQLSEDAELFFTGKAAFEYEDNLFRTSTGEVDDVAFVLTPGVELVFNDDAVTSLSIAYKHEFRFYEDTDNLDEDYAHFAAKAKYDSGIFLGTANASYDELSANFVNINSAADLVRRDITKIGASGKYQISDLTAFSVGLSYDETDFAPVSYFDTEATSLPVTFFYKIRPKVDLTAGYRYRDVSVSGVNNDYEDQYLFIGAVGELFSPKVQADIKFGFQERDGEAAGTDNSSATYNAKIAYLADAKSSYYVSIDRDFRNASTTGLSYAQTMIGVGGNFSLSESLSAMASIGVGEYEYEQSARAEDLIFLTLGGTYSPNDYLKLSVTYQYQDVDGNIPSASDYTNNKLIFSASVRY